MTIGLVNNEYGWERVLEQEKTPWEKISFTDLSRYSLIILNSRNLNENESNKIKSYLNNCGALLTDTLSFKKLYPNLKILRIYIKNIKGKNELFRNINKINIEKFGYKIKDSKAINSLKIGDGFAIILPFDLNQLMLDERSKELYFSSPHTPLKEHVSVVSKGDLRRLIINCFYYLFSKRNLPYIHLWYYPNKYESVFCYRMDLDVFNKNEINNIIKVAGKNKINFTWYLSVKNCENYKDESNKLYKSKQDIQSHSYEHKVYDSFEENYNSMSKADKFISEVARKPTGFVAPFGHWNKNLGKVLEKMNYDYSSEFSLSYDDLPFYPFLNKKSRIIQLPIYPTCIGLMRMKLYSKKQMKNYFDYLIDMQYKKQMPLFLYDHPNDGVGTYSDVLDHLLKKIKSFDNVLITNFNEFLTWWKRREKKKFNVSILDDELKINTNNKDKDVYLRIIMPDYKEVKIPLKNQIINLEKLNLNYLPEFKELSIRSIDIIKSKVFFFIFYLGILFKALRRRLF